MSESTAGPLAILPTRAVWDKRVTHSLFRVLAGISTHANANRVCNPKQSTLADELGISQQAVSKAARQLVALGYLKSERTRTKSGLPGYNVYRILFDQPDIFPGSHDTTSEVVSDTTSEVVSDTTSEVVARGTSPRQKESGPTEAKASGEQSYKNSLIRTDSFAAPAAPREKTVQKNPKDELSPDPLWVAFAEEMPVPATKSGRGAWTHALRELRDAGADAASVHTACAAYRDRWPAMLLTPTAIAKFWHVFSSLNGANHHDLTTSGPSQHQQFIHSARADSARSEARQRAEHAWAAFIWTLEPFELEQPESALRERFAGQHPDLAQWLPSLATAAR